MIHNIYIKEAADSVFSLFCSFFVLLCPTISSASFLVADDQEVLAFEAAIQRKCFHVAEDEWNTLEWLNDMGYLVSYSDDYAEVPDQARFFPSFFISRFQFPLLNNCSLSLAAAICVILMSGHISARTPST